jgi:hypothetical protein
MVIRKDMTVTRVDNDMLTQYRARSRINAKKNDQG